MMLKLKAEGRDVPLKVWKFPAGEVGVKIEDRFTHCFDNVVISLMWESNDDIMALIQLVDALQHEKAKEIVLNIPYFPYSRQDRRCFKGEGHALKMVANIINSLGFYKVFTKDAHSYVLEAVVDNLHNVEQHICATMLPIHSIMVAPDNGASKKVYKLAQYQTAKVIVADKQRDHTGKIVSTKIDVTTVQADETICVVDDLCDGGATFIELGKEIRKVLPNNVVNLYVTHGLFTKGVDELLSLYDNIYVHNLMNKSVENKVTTI